MSGIRYVLLDPTGNLTCLVTDPVKEEDRAGVTTALMDRCEQVGYLMPPRDPRAAVRLQMMGGEFCGNASMATAAYLAERDGAVTGDEREIPLEVSGAEGLVTCRVRRTEDGWDGSAEMPLPLGTEDAVIRGKKLTAVRMPGMTHLILDGETDAAEAEAVLREAAEIFDDPALGLLQWREAGGRMTPLVWVRGSGTTVWENACGSGTAALACRKSLAEKRSAAVSAAQPGGVLRAEAEYRDGGIRRVILHGHVRIGETGTVSP